ncbi:hypothetical protein C8R45DRAFT_1078886 [Mycena sanguinolenta]|nr:hypothetical protein C8R45DRAFT_1078886 [Mycena sanguinolenta]
MYMIRDGPRSTERGAAAQKGADAPQKKPTRRKKNNKRETNEGLGLNEIENNQAAVAIVEPVCLPTEARIRILFADMHKRTPGLTLKHVSKDNMIKDKPRRRRKSNGPMSGVEFISSTSVKTRDQMRREKHQTRHPAPLTNAAHQKRTRTRRQMEEPTTYPNTNANPTRTPKRVQRTAQLADDAVCLRFYAVVSGSVVVYGRMGVFGARAVVVWSDVEPPPGGGGAVGLGFGLGGGGAPTATLSGCGEHGVGADLKGGGRRTKEAEIKWKELGEGAEGAENERAARDGEAFFDRHPSPREDPDPEDTPASNGSVDMWKGMWNTGAPPRVSMMSIAVRGQTRRDVRARRWAEAGGSLEEAASINKA